MLQIEITEPVVLALIGAVVTGLIGWWQYGKAKNNDNKIPPLNYPPITKADDLFAANNEMFKSVLNELREMKSILSDILIELVRLNGRRD